MVETSGNEHEGTQFGKEIDAYNALTEQLAEVRKDKFVEIMYNELEKEILNQRRGVLEKADLIRGITKINGGNESLAEALAEHAIKEIRAKHGISEPGVALKQNNLSKFKKKLPVKKSEHYFETLLNDVLTSDKVKQSYNTLKGAMAGTDTQRISLAEEAFKSAIIADDETLSTQVDGLLKEAVTRITAQKNSNAI